MISKLISQSSGGMLICAAYSCMYVYVTTYRCGALVSTCLFSCLCSHYDRECVGARAFVHIVKGGDNSSKKGSEKIGITSTM